ncbi:MAG TPA: SO2930 family diheme c-type cytochrome [Myxococcaceae bacterium]|nr:SO2930 family diheme c-type cytochrome [Myxococcaceae bacterium]
MSRSVQGVVASALLALGACGSKSSAPCTPRLPMDDTVPGTLAEWCQVELTQGDVAPLSGDVVPFALTTPLYSDGAIKRRTVRVPPGRAATYDETQALEFPDGTVFTKSFGFRQDARNTALPIHWVETRVEWKAAGAWNFMSYRWNDTGTEAVALPGGEVVSFSYVDVDGVSQDAHYLVPSRLQCEQCHAESGAVAPIGPKARLLNTEYPYDSGSENQLAHWSRTGMLSGAPDPASAPKLPVASDPDAGTVEQRARAYLEANCGFCHNPTGNARVSGLFLRADVTSPDQLGICKKPVAAGPGAGGRPFDIVPGAPDQSVIPYRMEATTPAVAMPQIGRSVVDAHGVALVTQWIAEMAGTCD